MRLLRKGEPPPAWREREAAEAETLDESHEVRWARVLAFEREALKGSLLNEQEARCGYCTEPISAGRMRVEHWAPRSTTPDLLFAYENLLACCEGMAPNGRAHCDRKKDATPIELSPWNADHMAAVRFYRLSGELYFVHANAERLLNDAKEVLGLNDDHFLTRRRGVLERVWNETKAARRHTKAADLAAEIERWESSAGRSQLHAAAVVGMLREALDRLAAEA